MKTLILKVGSTLKIQVFNRKLKYYKNNNAIGFNTKI